jgi:hypothetical protein
LWPKFQQNLIVRCVLKPNFDYAPISQKFPKAPKPKSQNFTKSQKPKGEMYWLVSKQIMRAQRPVFVCVRCLACHLQTAFPFGSRSLQRPLFSLLSLRAAIYSPVPSIGCIGSCSYNKLQSGRSGPI